MAVATIYPSHDKGVSRVVASEDFSTIINGAGTNVSFATVNADSRLEADSVTDNYESVSKYMCIFDTSSLDGSTITSVELSVFAALQITDLGTTDLVVMEATPADNTNIVASDFQNFGTTEFGTIPLSSMTSDAYNTITLNSSGEDNINTSGKSEFGLMLRWIFEESFGGSWNSNSITQSQFSGGEAVISKKPYLTITYDEAVVAVNDALFFGCNF